jgi:hypothetical protein
LAIIDFNADFVLLRKGFVYVCHVHIYKRRHTLQYHPISLLSSQNAYFTLHLISNMSLSIPAITAMIVAILFVSALIFSIVLQYHMRAQESAED